MSVLPKCVDEHKHAVLVETGRRCQNLWRELGTVSFHMGAGAGGPGPLQKQPVLTAESSLRTSADSRGRTWSSGR